MKLKKFKKVIEFFKSDATKREELAIYNFYTRFLILSDINVMNELVNNYTSAGFRIKKEHEEIIGKDPFEYLILNIKSKEPNDNIEVRERNNNELFKKIWLNVEPNYKNELRKCNYILLLSEEAKENEQYMAESKIKKFFPTRDSFLFYVNEVFNAKEIKDMQGFRKGIEIIYTYYNRYPSISKPDLAIIDTLMEKMNMIHVIESHAELCLIFNKKSKNKNKKVNENIILSNDQKHIQETIKVLSYYENKFINQDSEKKIIFKELLNDLNSIAEYKNIEMEPEIMASTKKIVDQHLPELLVDYFEMPERIRYTYKDDSDRTPKEIFSETLIHMSKQARSIVDNLYVNNFTNIKIKNRFVKSQ